MFIFRKYSQLLVTRPFTTNAITAMGLFGLGDAIC